MAYSTGIPILYLVISATAFTFYWVDKYLFTRWYRTPPQYDAQISLQFSSYLPYAALLHLLFGVWMIANRRMFASDTSYDIIAPTIASTTAASSNAINATLNATGGTTDATDSTSLTTNKEFHQTLLSYLGEANGKKTDILSCLTQPHVGPMLVALGSWIVYLVLNELWHIVGPPLRRIARCLTCGKCGHPEIIDLRDDYHLEEDHMKQYGLASYNIFDNPIYQSMFNISQEYADQHVHVESLLLTEMKTPEKVEVSKVHVTTTHKAIVNTQFESVDTSSDEYEDEEED